MSSNDKVTIHKLPTGVPGLDEIVGGGLPECVNGMGFGLQADEGVGGKEEVLVGECDKSGGEEAGLEAFGCAAQDDEEEGGGSEGREEIG